MVCLALELVGPWVVLGFSVGTEVFDELLSINVPWSQEFSGVLRELKFSLDLSLLPLVFSRIVTVASRLLHLYSTINKTSLIITSHPAFTKRHMEDLGDHGLCHLAPPRQSPTFSGCMDG